MIEMKLRSPIRWFGGKGNMLGKLLPIVPNGGKPYCEPYAGGASIFFSRDPAPVEVLNDMNGDLVNFFRCFQDKEAFEELRHRIMWTPYARAEFVRALEIRNSNETDTVLRAWAFFVSHNQGMSGVAKTAGNWGRTFVSNAGVANTVNKWLMRLSMLDAWRWRLMQAQIDNRDAIEVIRYWDSDDTVFYVDPPYHHDTRKSTDMYMHECGHEHHVQLVNTLLECKGAVVLSGYSHDVYKPLEDAGWERIDFNTACYAAGRTRNSGLQGEGKALEKVKRVECVWRNPVAMLRTGENL